MGPFEGEMRRQVVNVKLELPRLDFGALLCAKGEESGLVETMLFSACMLNTSAAARTHLQEPGEADLGMHSLASADMQAAFGQLVRVTPATRDSPNGMSGRGISRNASRIPYYCDWTSLPGVGGAFVPCVILETGIQRVAARANLSLGPPSYPASRNSSLKTISCSGKRVEPARPLEGEEEAAESEILVEVGPILTNFGLLQSIEEEGWPLYDLLAPVLSAWVRTAHSLHGALGASLAALELRRKLALSWLLTLALDGDAEPVGKSRLAPAKRGWTQLSSCPSCQLLVSLLRYARTKTEPRQHLDVLRDVQGREGLEIRQVTALGTNFKT